MITSAQAGAGGEVSTGEGGEGLGVVSRARYRLAVQQEEHEIYVILTIQANQNGHSKVRMYRVEAQTMQTHTLPNVPSPLALIEVGS